MAFIGGEGCLFVQSNSLSIQTYSRSARERFAGVSEAKAEREPAGEILSGAKAESKDLPHSPPRTLFCAPALRFGASGLGMFADRQFKGTSVSSVDRLYFRRIKNGRDGQI